MLPRRTLPPRTTSSPSSPVLLPFARALRTSAFCGLLVVLLTAGCGSEENASEAPPKPTHHTLVFLDRSASAQGDASARALFADSLARIVRMHLRRPGDRVRAFLLNEKTRSKAYRLDLRNDVRPLQQKDFPDEQALENARYKKAVAEYMADATSQLQAFAAEADLPAEYARWTDLWGTLEVASEELPSPAAAQQPVARHLYYLSDMFESMPGDDRRNFDRQPPQDRSQAEAWATRDAERIRSLLTLSSPVLRNARVRVLQGTLATKPHAQDVKVYWQTLFQALDMAPGRVVYN